MHLFKNKLFALILVTILALGLLLFLPNGQINYFGDVTSLAISPFQGVINFVNSKVQGITWYFRDIQTLRDENIELKLRMDELESERIGLLEHKFKNAELREALNIKEQFSEYELIGANIIGKDLGNWFKVFTIDRGTRDGMRVNHSIINRQGLVGRIIGTDMFSSKVESIIDPKSSVSARISKSRDLVVVKGDLKLSEQGLCRMDYIPIDSDLAVGDTVETSGLGGYYPRGIIIGRVKEIRESSSRGLRYAIIEPAVDFRRLEEVFVLADKEIDE